MPAGIVAFCRFLIAFLALIFIQGKRHEKIAREDFKYIILLGFVGYFISVGAQLLGTHYAGASLASLINALNPVTMTIFAAVFLRENLTVRKVIGVLLALAGVYVILGKGSGDSSLWGVLLSLMSVLIWSLVSVLTKRISAKYDSVTVTRNAVGVATICYFPVCVVEIAQKQGIHVDASGILGLLYMGIVCTGMSYLLWNKSLSILEAGTCSAFYPLQPLISTILGVILLHEKIGLAFILGSLLIIAGVLVNLSSSSKRLQLEN